jgi:hypothetical protein
MPMTKIRMQRLMINFTSHQSVPEVGKNVNAALLLIDICLHSSVIIYYIQNSKATLKNKAHSSNRGYYKRNPVAA